MIRGIVEAMCHNVARGRYEGRAQWCGGVRCYVRKEYMQE